MKMLKKKLLPGIITTLFIASAARTPHAPAAPLSSPASPEGVVQKQIEAYNARGIDA